MNIVAGRQKHKARKYIGVGVVERGDSWRIWWYVDGKRQFDTLPKEICQTYQRAFEEAMRRKYEGFVNEETITFEDWCTKYIATKRDINPEPLQRYSGHFNGFLKKKGYDQRMKKISQDQIKEFLHYYENEPGHNANGAKKALEYLREIFKAAVKNKKKVISADPTDGIKKPKQQKEIKILPSKQDKEKIAKWFLKNDRLMFTQLYFEARFGWRRSELGKMIVSDIDFDRERIRVKHYKQKDAKEYALDQEMLTILNEHIILLKKRNLYRKDGFLFPSRTGKMKNKDFLLNKLKKAAKELGIEKNITNHIFRHSAITEMLDAGLKPEDVKQLTGHKDTATILNFYSHASKEQVDRGLQVTRLELGKEMKRG